MIKLEHIREPIKEKVWRQSDGCGCVWWTIRTKKHLVGITALDRCELHRANKIGGQLLVSRR